MQKEIELTYVKFGETFYYKGCTFVKSHCILNDGPNLSGFYFCIREGMDCEVYIEVPIIQYNVALINCSTIVYIDIPTVKLNSVAIGSKFRYSNNEYIKVNYTTPESRNYQYGLNGNDVISFISNPDVEPVD